MDDLDVGAILAGGLLFALFTWWTWIFTTNLL